MRVLFAGSPAIAVPALERVFSLSKNVCEIAGVLTNPDMPKGRGGKFDVTDVGKVAVQLGVPVLKLEKLDASAREAVRALCPDILVSFAYGRIFGPKFLALFPLGGINIHPSLLPKYRGPSPIQAAILNMEAETGISIQRLDLEMDSGDILLQEKLPLIGRETTVGLNESIAQKAADLLEKALAGIATGSITGTPQNSADATFCRTLTKEDGFIDWTMSAQAIDACVRAFNPWPLAWTRHTGARLFILEAHWMETGAVGTPGGILCADKQNGILVQTGKGVLAITKLQLETKKALDWQSFLNGARNFLGTRFEI
ncbi:MAG: methionyl-tRNA formyltransferase [Treponema sp.]|jgi:methionyl-tRNA formyltransferase|nr:methionyl-tRNA formyltransferase [Treponema sp.]